MNKRLELSALIHEHNPDMIRITEILTQIRDVDPETQEFHIDGYDHHTNLEGRHKRGVIMYTKSHLNATISHIAGEEKFEESLWCGLKLKGAVNLLIGVVYRSANCNRDNHDHFSGIVH